MPKEDVNKKLKKDKKEEKNNFQVHRPKHVGETMCSNPNPPFTKSLKEHVCLDS
jgi:hypothetical protein